MENSIYYRLKLLEGSIFHNTNSKAGAWLQYTLVAVDPGCIKASLKVREDMTNPNGMLHGGMSAMVCDELLGLAFYSLGFETNYTTLNLAVDFLRGIALHETIQVEAKVLRAGKRIANVECYIYNEKGEIAVHATTNLANTDKKVFDLHNT
ncbi:MAG: PaaI family thioesterase [Chitinophagaceae bacterium]